MTLTNDQKTLLGFMVFCIVLFFGILFLVSTNEKPIDKDKAALEAGLGEISPLTFEKLDEDAIDSIDENIHDSFDDFSDISLNNTEYNPSEIIIGRVFDLIPFRAGDILMLDYKNYHKDIRLIAKKEHEPEQDVEGDVVTGPYELKLVKTVKLKIVME